MKKPEDTKRALHCCLVENEDVCECEVCPYAVNGNSTLTCDVSVGKDTLAYIELLEQRVPRWISVEDRLPEDFHDVLVVVTSAVNGWRFRAIDARRNGRWIIYPDSAWRTITHWIPLPELPEEGER